jgi:predicted TIM-barrel fold metal-dependent hydrolase
VSKTNVQPRRPFIIDSHCNLGKSTLFDIEENADSLKHKLELLGIGMAVVGPFGKDLVAHVEAGNTKVKEAVSKYPSSFIGLAGANPWIRESVPALTRHITRAGLKGIKLNPSTQGFMVNSEIVWPILEVAEKMRVPVMIHSGTPVHSLPLNIADLASRFPDVTIIMAHMGYSDFFGDAIVAAKRCKNILLETSLMPVVGMIERAKREVGYDRILYGSSSPNGSMELELFKIETAKLTQKEREAILGGNAKRVFKIERG